MSETNLPSDHGISRTEILRRFQEAWDNGQQPDLEEFAKLASEDVRQSVLADLINFDLQQRRKIGESPSPTEYEKRFPADRPTISAAFDAINDTIGDEPSQRDPALGSTEVDVAVGEMLGKYEIRSVLGVGGMGVVFAAFDTVIRREVAIKLLSVKHSTNENALSRLLQEAQTAGAVHHPNIVGIYDVLEVGGAYYVVMEKVNGDDLSEVLKKSERGYLDWKLATRILMDCCDALTEAHRRGLIHRDIKPQNIMLTVESTVKLLDFGLAKSDQSTDTALTQDGTVLGTPDFMSPEQCRAGEINRLTDIYSLGATFFALLTGHPPFSSMGTHLKVMFAHCNQPVPSVAEEHPDVPAGCDTIISRAMAKRPEERYQSAQELRADLEVLESYDASATIAMDAPQPAAEPHPIPWKIIAVAVLSIAAILGTVTFSSAFRSGNEGRVERDQAGDLGSSPHVAAATFRGVTADTIHLGTTTAFNGPNEELGRNMVIGMKTYFNSVNDAGGIRGRRIDLTVLDDRYVPDTALENMQQLFEEREVFATIGNVGTPTGKVTSSYSSENGYLFFAPFTGASLLREDPPDRYIFNYRASYQDETAAMVKYFVDTLDIPPRQVAVFAQNDSYGDDGFAGVAKAMKNYGVDGEDLLRVGYDRNQLDIEDAVTAILESEHDIRAIVMVPTYKVAARFIKRIRTDSPDIVFGAVSFVGSQALAEEFREIGPSFGEGVLVTQVVPPYMSNATGVLNYRKLLAKYYPEYEPGFVSLEGFIAAAVMVEGLRTAGEDLTTENLIDAFHRIDDFDLGIGPIIKFSPSRHQASDRVWGTRLTANSEFENIDLE